jgi:hypothetical protein
MPPLAVTCTLDAFEPGAVGELDPHAGNAAARATAAAHAAAIDQMEAEPDRVDGIIGEAKVYRARQRRYGVTTRSTRTAKAGDVRESTASPPIGASTLDSFSLGVACRS